MVVVTVVVMVVIPLCGGLESRQERAGIVVGGKRRMNGQKQQVSGVTVQWDPPLRNQVDCLERVSE